MKEHVETNGKKLNRKLRWGRKRRSLKQQIHEHKGLAIVYLSLRIIVLAMVIFQLLQGNYQHAFYGILALVLFTVPSFVEDNFHIDIPNTLEIIVLFFIFAAQILGEMHSYYTRFPFWDTMLHTVNGFLAAAIGFSLLELLNRDEHFTFHLSPFYLSVTAFCFSMTIGVLWEFFEYGMDMLFLSDMQKDTWVTAIHSVSLNAEGLNKVEHIPIESLVVNGEDWLARYGGYLDIGLKDTMKDLLVNFIGALVFSVIGYFYVKSKGKGRFARHFIPRAVQKEKAAHDGDA